MYTETSFEAKTKELRANLLKMLCEAGSGHSGGSLSCIDILYVLYHEVMTHDPANPGWEGRDRFVLSKGHVCPALYTVLADCGYFPKEELSTLRKFGSKLQGHPYMNKTKGLDVSSGSLGQGLSVAVGMALSLKMDQAANRVYCLMGDGEQQEGEIWEAAMAAAHYRLGNLCAIVDHNHLQIDGFVEHVMNVESLAEKWRSFGWNVIEIDGHTYADIVGAFERARNETEKPSVIIAETVKGKGVSFMENRAEWHGVSPNKAQLAQALSELEQEETA